MEVRTITAEELNEELGYRDKSELSLKKQKKYENMAKKYIIHENLVIARVARKTINYIENNVVNFPNSYNVLKTRIISTCYDTLEWIYRANVFQDINDKKEIVVNIQMLNFYLNEALNKELISYKKFESYSNHLIKLDSMVRSWFKYETSK